MHNTNPLYFILLFLMASVVAVPLFRRIKLGAILGYLVAGMVLGPFGLAIITDPVTLLHFAEIGVVLLLFIIGLELDPHKLWSMRRSIAGLGGGQLLISASLIGVVAGVLMEGLAQALVIGLALGLSSTAFAVQLMAEKGFMARPVGRRGFAILLFQDLSVIPILFLVGAVSTRGDVSAVAWYWPVVAVVGLVISGRYLVIPGLGVVTRYGSHETMTAASLLIVVGAAYLMYAVGLSMGLGAFIAGILLANSSFKHQLECDIEPFKGITLGLFFMAIGMTLDLALFWQNPLLVLCLALLLMVGKAAVITALMRAARIDWQHSVKVGLMLSQGGEFAFVIVSQALAGGVLDSQICAQLNLIVGISMALTSPLVGLSDYLLRARPSSVEPSETPVFDQEPEVLILGFGRFGQTTGRILAANNIPFSAIDKNAEHIAFVRRFGNKVFFGDAGRMDVLQAAGIAKVKVVLVAVDDVDKATTLVKRIREQYPLLRILARARNRSAYWALKAAGADDVIRELFRGSLEAAEHTLTAIGYTGLEALRCVEAFDHHDRQLLNETYEHRDDLEALIEKGKAGRADLERLFRADQQ